MSWGGLSYVRARGVRVAQGCPLVADLRSGDPLVGLNRRCRRPGHAEHTGTNASNYADARPALPHGIPPCIVPHLALPYGCQRASGPLRRDQRRAAARCGAPHGPPGRQGAQHRRRCGGRAGRRAPYLLARSRKMRTSVRSPRQPTASMMDHIQTSLSFLRLRRWCGMPQDAGGTACRHGRPSDPRESRLLPASLHVSHFVARKHWGKRYPSPLLCRAALTKRGERHRCFLVPMSPHYDVLGTDAEPLGKNARVVCPRDYSMSLTTSN